MSTKYLARSIIEGGRSGHYKAECRRRMSEERAAWRAEARIIARDPEGYEDLAKPEPRRGHVSVEFSDKLSIVYRFLESNVGRSWDAVRSELCEKFDTRTTQGRHILFDHLLKDVSESPEGGRGDLPWAPANYYRAADGTLQEGEYWKKNRWWPPQKKVERPAPLHAVARWLGPVKIGRAGRGFARYVSTGSERVCAVVERGEIVYAACDSRGEAIYVPQPPTVYTNAYSGRVTSYPQPPKLLLARSAFQQEGLLDAREAKVVRGWPERVQKMVCALAPCNH
jgi:hypothetical protein